jgi:hypothetical protein
MSARETQKNGLDVERVQVPVVLCPICQTPYILRPGFTFPAGIHEYMYQRDCKHKTTPGNDDIDGEALLMVVHPAKAQD